MTKRMTVDEDSKAVLDQIVEQADSYTYAREALRDITDALDDIDLREHDDYNNPVDVLVDGAHASNTGGIEPADYDPDAEIEGWLDSETVRVIVSKPGVELNPAHVNSASKPRDRVDKRKMIAAMTRYRYRDAGKAHVERIYDLVDATFGRSETIREYVPEVIDHHFWQHPRKDRIVFTDPKNAGPSVKSRVEQFRDRIMVAGEYNITAEKRKTMNDLRRDVEKLEPFADEEPVAGAIEAWNALVEDIREAGETEGVEFTADLEGCLETFDV